MNDHHDAHLRQVLTNVSHCEEHTGIDFQRTDGEHDSDSHDSDYASTDSESSQGSRIHSLHAHANAAHLEEVHLGEASDEECPRRNRTGGYATAVELELPPMDIWECSACTFHNESLDGLVCSMCGSRRASETSLSADAGTVRPNRRDMRDTMLAYAAAAVSDGSRRSDLDDLHAELDGSQRRSDLDDLRAELDGSQSDLDDLHADSSLDEEASDEEDSDDEEEYQPLTLPIRIITQVDLDRGPVDRKECIICMDDYEVGQTQATLPCFHVFHANCIRQWLTRSSFCPICKHDARERDLPGPEVTIEF